jgi:hypothetical protein
MICHSRVPWVGSGVLCPAALPGEVNIYISLLNPMHKNKVAKNNYFIENIIVTKLIFEPFPEIA